jgi:hypothetical protein
MLQAGLCMSSFPWHESLVLWQSCLFTFLNLHSQVGLLRISQTNAYFLLKQLSDGYAQEDMLGHWSVSKAIDHKFSHTSSWLFWTSLWQNWECGPQTCTSSFPPTPMVESQSERSSDLYVMSQRTTYLRYSGPNTHQNIVIKKCILRVKNTAFWAVCRALLAKLINTQSVFFLWYLIFNIRVLYTKLQLLFKFSYYHFAFDKYGV